MRVELTKGLILSQERLPFRHRCIGPRGRGRTDNITLLRRAPLPKLGYPGMVLGAGVEPATRRLSTAGLCRWATPGYSVVKVQADPAGFEPALPCRRLPLSGRVQYRALSRILGDWVARIELAISCSRGRRDTASLHPDKSLGMRSGATGYLSLNIAGCLATAPRALGSETGGEVAIET